MLNKNVKVFVVYIAFFTLEISIYITHKAQITSLLVKKVNILANYLVFANAFWKKSAEMLLEQIRVNKHVIELKKG